MRSRPSLQDLQEAPDVQRGKHGSETERRAPFEALGYERMRQRQRENAGC